MKENWIEVSHGLPKNENFHLIYTSNGEFDFAWYSQIKKKWYWDAFDECGVNTVTHWQQLEKPVD